MMKRLLSALALTVFCGVSHGKGTFVGNGAGWVEANLIYAYQSIPKAIESCINSSRCELSDNEQSVLAKVNQKARMNRDRVYEIVHVLYGESADRVFNKRCGPVHRIACTARDNEQIFLNGESLYNEDGPSVDFPQLIGLLIHEIGHQVGYTDHALLDSAGSKVRRIMESNIVELTPPQDIDSFKVRLVNFAGSGSFPEMTLETRNSHYSFDDILLAFANGCTQGSRPVSFQVENLHWVNQGRRSALFSSTGMILTLAGWIKTSCSPEHGEMPVAPKVSEFKIYIKIRQEDANWKVEDVQAKADGFTHSTGIFEVPNKWFKAIMVNDL